MKIGSVDETMRKITSDVSNLIFLKFHDYEFAFAIASIMVIIS